MKPFHRVFWMVAVFALLFSGCAHDGALDRTAFSAIPSAAAGFGTSVSSDDLGSNTAEAGDDEFAEEDPVPEPAMLGSWNRTMFQFNDKFYLSVLKPLATGYRWVTPEFFRRGIKNFFENVAGPGRLINCLLQGKGLAAVDELSRFCMNSTFGLAGFMNPAEKYKNLKPTQEDFGQSLAVYGFGEGAFIVWPILGPSTLRDTIGKVGDYFLDPVSYVDPTETGIAISALEYLNDAPSVIDNYETLKEAALEPYDALRDAYIQHRRKVVSE